MYPLTDIDYGVVAVGVCFLALLLVWAVAMNKGHTYK